MQSHYTLIVHVALALGRDRACSDPARQRSGCGRCVWQWRVVDGVRCAWVSVLF